MSSKMELLSCFVNPVEDSQSIYRHLLKAMSEPGTCLSLDMDKKLLMGSESQHLSAIYPSTIYPNTWGLAQTLLDSDCQIYVSPTLSTPLFLQSLRFYTGVHLTQNPMEADFAFLTLPEWTDISVFSLGNAETPHLSSTLIIQVRELTTEPQLTLSGPGIKTKKILSISDLSEQQKVLLQRNRQYYPCGLDFIFCSPDSLCALPRSTSIHHHLPIRETT